MFKLLSRQNGHIPTVFFGFLSCCWSLFSTFVNKDINLCFSVISKVFRGDEGWVFASLFLDLFQLKEELKLVIHTSVSTKAVNESFKASLRLTHLTKSGKFYGSRGVKRVWSMQLDSKRGWIYSSRTGLWLILVVSS